MGSLSFSLGNNLEMKVRNDKDTTGKSPYKVISLIDNLSITGGYNFMADSMNWSNFNVNLRIKLPQPLNYTINLSGQFDPYLYGLSETGTPVRTNRRCWQVGKFPHFKGTNWSFSYTFNNELFRKWINGDGKEKKQEKGKLPDFDPDDPYATNPETGEFWTADYQLQCPIRRVEYLRLREDELQDEVHPQPLLLSFTRSGQGMASQHQHLV